MHEWFNLIAELIAYLIDQIEMLPELKNYSESLDPEQDEASKEEAEKILKESKNELDSPVLDKKAQGYYREGKTDQQFLCRTLCIEYDGSKNTMADDC